MINFEDRNIQEILHFTTNRGLLGTLVSKQLLSRCRLSDDKLLQHILYPNAVIRPEESEFFDKEQNWIDFVNLSISEINKRYFDVSNRWHKDRNIWWSILSFDPEILNHPNVFFATTNNSYEHCMRSSGQIGFESLFKPSIRRKGTWQANRSNRPIHLTTCEQAEVLYPRSVSTDWLRRIYVIDDETHDIVGGWLDEFGFTGIEIDISPAKFIGRHN
ncbi:DUF4433 domain-containing protein [Klebsiella oxytoca]|uniref:DarT ssDNA thymidine ADP-ribosyltransferase family protein n=1 Tax=Klebsiella oxytoca TaxID=571 RepID=UPI000658B815|nr:DarT ssDNA thymidine ADP-ribosyltransferase family protein [Klebsiella oxytoca]EKU2838382.1 DUF4433 domain-containing protein [Klebsiella oxytoca]EKU7502663.1 DUF4433 domain-containing protein [Klebsiella oxytoca]EKW9944230.1 DUF4433 domain-containing protein [Klebsiella oxytoca]ELB5501883.1 DUF4433 domain-containing protein [Klebsiella oxytoca]ELD4486929.1 DUF4433 domain-containing protein [Klebsiella oxytoca]